MPTPPVQFRDADLLTRIMARGDDRNEIARRDLARYYRLLGREFDGIDFSPAEWALIADATISTAFDDAMTAFDLGSVVFDAIHLDGAAATWGVDPGALLTKISQSRPAQIMAIVDRLERSRHAIV